MKKKPEMKVKLTTKQGKTLIFKTVKTPINNLLDVITNKEGGFIYDEQAGMAVRRTEIESVKILKGWFSK